MNELELIAKLSNSFGPPGFEEEVVDLIVSQLEGFACEWDYMNNLYVHHPHNRPGKPVIMLDAHTDEVGFMVHSINDNGTLNFIGLGGWAGSNIPAHEVIIKTGDGKKHTGITVSKPPHFMTAEEKAGNSLTIEQMTIDVGTSSKKATEDIFGIKAGDPICPKVSFSYNDKTDVMLGKAMDNRLGCAAVIKILEELIDEDLPYNLVGAFATQEEMGLRGAAVTSQTIAPDFAIVFEGTPADDLYTTETLSQAALHNGPQIRHLDSSYLAHRRFIDYAKQIAHDHNLPYQSTVRRSGGTNAGKIHLSGKGVPVLVLGIPSRFIHTHYAYSSLSDFKHTVALGLALIRNFDPEALRHKPGTAAK